jgi:flagellar hook assembly protein FlgD
VILAVYNVAGQHVATLVDELLTEGRKQITWDGTNSLGSPVSTGVYFYRLQTGGRTLTKKMIVMK